MMGAGKQYPLIPHWLTLMLLMSPASEDTIFATALRENYAAGQVSVEQRTGADQPVQGDW